ncbi:Actin-related protein 2 [Camellia lanceoleosa]|uniref:Actin-related protein 2 n=1 Tax=Camellia lanceoleosa TaxID=1840588 RepID=A0ACC0H152_9ERIC|nr:Actin-related protein 2 [Camellia lanceoleosa]
MELIDVEGDGMADMVFRCIQEMDINNQMMSVGASVNRCFGDLLSRIRPLPLSIPTPLLLFVISLSLFLTYSPPNPTPSKPSSHHHPFVLIHENLITATSSVHAMHRN